MHFFRLRSTSIKAAVLASLLAVSVDAFALGKNRVQPVEPPAPPLIPSDVTANPSDDPKDYSVDSSVGYRVRLSQVKWIVPSQILPQTISPGASNNNVAITFHEGRLFMAWRSSQTHFASTKSAMHVISSSDFGSTWTHELTVKLGTDVREPTLLSYGGRLIFKFFEGGTNPLAFEPKAIWMTERYGLGKWTDLKIGGEKSEVPWEVKVRDGVAYMTSYTGNHYEVTKASSVKIHFKKSTDGENWTSVNPDVPNIYVGGCSETAFEFLQDGSIAGVSRNEDGDDTGFGSQIGVSQDPFRNGWSFLKKSDPERYDSPRMFRHGKDLYLVARRDLGGPFDGGWGFLPLVIRRIAFLAHYSLTPKRTALYRVDPVNRRVIHFVDLPSAGDTAFPSVTRLSANAFLVANYTSPLNMSDASWIQGQISPRGTQIYLQTIYLEPEH